MEEEAQGAGRKAQGNCETGETSETGGRARRERKSHRAADSRQQTAGSRQN